MAVDLLSLTEVLALTGLSERTFYRVRARGEFPEPIQIAANKRLVIWRSDDVDTWRKLNPPAPRVHRDP